MRHRIAICSVLLSTLALVGAGPLPDPHDLVRQGNAAYARGDYPAARDYYEKAEGRITDPGLAAFNKAVALYQLEQFRDAELHFRACLEDAEGPRRGRAFFGLGNSLLQQKGDRGAQALQEAIDAYAACLREEELAPELAASARHNRELAKLLLAQVPPPNKDRESPDTSHQKNKNDRKAKPDENPRLSPSKTGKEKPDPRNKGTPVKPDTGHDPIPTNERQPAQGSVPPVPDKSELSRMNSQDAERHLDLAVERIGQERRTYRYKAARAPGSGVLDW